MSVSYSLASSTTFAGWKYSTPSVT
jgi:hypothetical protein